MSNLSVKSGHTCHLDDAREGTKVTLSYPCGYCGVIRTLPPSTAQKVAGCD